MNPPLLEIKDLCVNFDTEHGSLNVLDNISFKIEAGKTLGLVGESGSGKSVTSLAIMKLLPQPSGHIRQGQIIYKNTDLTKIPSKEMRPIRGSRIAMIFQEPMTALNPVKSIGKQIMEVFELHRPDLNKKQRLSETIEILEKVGISEASKRVIEFPHQLSGGMRQRVMIAMALACKPDLLIADEPTTALDVTIQAQILDLMKEIQSEYGMAMLFITHDLGVIAELCDDVVVMYAGQIVEKADVSSIFLKPKHPYTKGLLDSIPKLDQPSKSRLKTIEGQVPTLNNMPSGCRFYNRCAYRQNDCKQLTIKHAESSSNFYVNCLHWREL